MKITRYADIEIRLADEQTRTVAGVAAVLQNGAYIITANEGFNASYTVNLGGAE